MIKPLTLTKPIINLYQPNDTRKLCSFNVQNELLGELSVTTSPHSDGVDRFLTELKDKFGKQFGKEVFDLEQNSNKITGLYVEVAPEYRNKKSFRFGEILRLSTIINILENNISTFKIYSKNTAIYFHSKYKLLPDIQNFVDRDQALKSIIGNNQSGFEAFSPKAQGILNRIKTERSGAAQRALRSETNTLTTEYIQKVMQEKGQYKSHPFNFGMDMELTRENILENKDFFNALFKKHGIDYEI